MTVSSYLSPTSEATARRAPDSVSIPISLRTAIMAALPLRSVTQAKEIPGDGRMPVPFVDVDETQAVHSSVGQLFGSRRMPFLIPSYGFLAFVDDFLEAPPLGESIFLLVPRNPIPVMAVAAVVLQRNFRRDPIPFPRRHDRTSHCEGRRYGCHAGNTCCALY